jgi:DNA-binding transcriptional MerR regulator
MPKKTIKDTFSTGDVIAVVQEVVGALSPATLHYWCAQGLLGESVRGQSGSGSRREFTPMQLLALAEAVAWQRAYADPGRVADVLRFLARQKLDFVEAELAAGRTFPVPQIMLRDEFIMPVPGTGIFVEPQLQPGEEKAAKLLAELDLAVIWRKVKAAIAKLPPSRPRGRRRKNVE